MIMKKSEIAEKIHNTILERIIINDIDELLLHQQMETLKHDSKDMISAKAREAQLQQTRSDNERVLKYIEKKITAYKFDEDVKISNPVVQNKE